MQLKEARDHGFKNYQDYQDFLSLQQRLKGSGIILNGN
jgi:hypothetical protein